VIQKFRVKQILEKGKNPKKKKRVARNRKGIEKSCVGRRALGLDETSLKGKELRRAAV